MGKTNSQDQCASSGCVHGGRQGLDMTASFFVPNPELSMNVRQPEISQPVMQVPYPCADPYFGGLYTAYGPHNMIQPQVVAAAAGRIPLPADIPEDGPIYVNAKQYHGILRRRQIRAKLEAQNKLVKNRKPYLHESRHQHALNRVRGSGGRFLSTKKAHEKPNSSGPNNPNSFLFGETRNVSNYDGPDRYNGGPSTGQDNDGGFSSHMAVQVQGRGLVYGSNHHYASVVQ